MLASPKAAFFFYSFDARNMKPATALHVSSSSYSFCSKRHMKYSLNYSCSLIVYTEKNKSDTSTTNLRFVRCVWAAVSLLLRLFSLFCFVFVSLVWTGFKFAHRSEQGVFKSTDMAHACLRPQTNQKTTAFYSTEWCTHFMISIDAHTHLETQNCS